MEWLVDPDGWCMPLTATEAALIDAHASFEDAVAAFERMKDAIQRSRALVADSRRWRRMRHSGLRVVSLDD